MSRMDECIQRAIDAGEVDPQRGRQAQAKYRDMMQRYMDQGNPEDMARVMAADDLLGDMVTNTQKRRHTMLAQLRDVEEAQARYAGKAAEDPDALLKQLDQAELQQRALEQSFMSNISELLQRHRTNVIGQVRDIAKLNNLVRELHGQDTGDAIARQLADAVRDTQERARSLYNSLGGDIGKLANRGLAHIHNADKIETAGFEAWFKTLWDNRLIDWSRIENFDTGKPFAVSADARPFESDARRFLEQVYEGITSKGWNTREPSLGMGGTAMYNRRKEHRVLHFRDGDAWMQYNDAFGQYNPFEAIVGELRGMARDIALMSNFGPNPTQGVEFRAQILAKQVAGVDGERLVSGLNVLAGGLRASAGDLKKVRTLRSVIDRKNKKARVVLRHLNGAVNVPHDKFMAAFFAGTRNLLTAAQLGAAPLSQLSDLGTMRLAAKAIGMNPTAPLVQTMKLLTSNISQQEARDMGYVFDTWFDTGSAHARFMGDIWSPEITSRITNAVLRANGLAMMTDRARTAMRVTFSHELGEQAGKSFADLDPRLRRFMENRGLTAAEWDLLRDPAVMFTSPGGGKVITPSWFVEHSSLPRAQAERLALKLGGIIEARTELGVPSASARGRATLLGDRAPGSIPGELLNSGVMYKSYALSVMFNQIQRVAEMSSLGEKGTYIVAFMSQMTILGAVSLQLKDIAKGNDPRPMTTPTFWAQAFLQGGGIGIFGDFFSSTTSRTGGGLGETAAGPVIGAISDVGRAVNSNVARVADGKAPLIGRDMVNLLRRYNPLATFQPLLPIPTRLALDRLLWDQIQPLVDPEVEDLRYRAEQRLKRDYNTQSWWRRGDPAPSRGPDLSNAMRTP
ncbi:hypothetical protein ACVDG3_18320 [Meridianimarinicoccus sp. RP-17]|uniref:hypothetical protein n=1 Tax=Meridianimarinicoccus zhengii TaxID=2056810 RepID=UPI000DAD118B|nr:hypothetical protein [Phycocomes zhengii]